MACVGREFTGFKASQASMPRRRQCLTGVNVPQASMYCSVIVHGTNVGKTFWSILPGAGYAEVRWRRLVNMAAGPWAQCICG